MELEFYYRLQSSLKHQIRCSSDFVGDVCVDANFETLKSGIMRFRHDGEIESIDWPKRFKFDLDPGCLLEVQLSQDRIGRVRCCLFSASRTLAHPFGDHDQSLRVCKH